MEIYDFSGELIDVSAKTEMLTVMWRLAARLKSKRGAAFTADQWFCFNSIVAGGRKITKICRSRAARLRNARGRARARRPPLESCTFPCVQNSIFKNLENQALLHTETLSRLYTIVNNINILFSKSSVLPSPRWTHVSGGSSTAPPLPHSLKRLLKPSARILQVAHVRGSGRPTTGSTTRSEIG